MNREEKYYQYREKDQREPYTTTTRNNSTGLYQDYRQNSELTITQEWNKMREFWSGIIQEVKEEYRDQK